MLFELNLQLFATQTTDMNTQGNDLSPEMKTYYDMRLIDEAAPALVHEQFGQKRPIPANGGKTIEFRKFDSLPDALTPLTEGVTPEGNKLNVTAITATVKQYGDYITQSDVLELTTIDNTILEATKILGRQAGSTMDAVVRNALAAGTNYLAAQNKGEDPEDVIANGDVITIDDVKKAVAILKSNNTPSINGDFIGIIHPMNAYHLMNDPKWEEYHKYTTSENLYEGEIGKIAGVRFVETTNATVYKNASGKAYGTIIMGEGAYGVTEITGGGLQTIIKQKGSAGTSDPLDQRSSVGWKGMKVAKILVPQYMINILSKCDDENVIANVDVTAG